MFQLYLNSAAVHFDSSQSKIVPPSAKSKNPIDAELIIWRY